MATLQDILTRTLYMSVFIIVVPIGAYTIHSGSSALVALVWYLLLSLSIPFIYISSKESGFGPNSIRVRRWIYPLAWLVIQGLTYQIFLTQDLTMLWMWPTVGRDIAFIMVMYVQTVLSLWFAYGMSRLAGGNHE